MCSSTALQAGAQLAQGASDSGTAKANARMAEYEAQSAQSAGNYKASLIRDAGARQRGSTTVAQAAAGADLSSGSAALVDTQSATNVEKDALLAGFEGNQQAWAKRAQAKIYKAQGRAALVNAGLSAGATILGGFEKAATAGAGGG